MKASRKDFQAIADLLKEHRCSMDIVAWNAIVIGMADILKRSNVSFDRGRFMDACNSV